MILYNVITVVLLLFMLPEEISAPILLANYQQTGEYIESDRQGNMYIVNKNKVSRYNLSGRNSGDYTWGYNITSVDASDPNRILIFSKGDRVVKYLDGTMNQYSADIKLDELGFESPSVACSDNIDGFWVYDSQQDQVFQINSNLRVTTSSYSLSAVSKSSFVPKQMRLRNKQILLSDPYIGVMILNNSGNYINTIPLFGVVDFDVNANGEIGFFINGKIITYNMNDGKRSDINLKVGDYNSASITMNSEPPIVFIMNNIGVRAYGF